MDNSSLYFWFLKVLHVHVTTQKKHHCDTQRSRPVLLLDLCCPWNKGRLQKRNTLSKPPSYRPFTNFHAYFMFLHTLYACLALWDPHTDVNWHLRNTWLLWFFTKLENWSSYAERLPIFPCIILDILSSGLVMICIMYHAGVTWIFAMVWVVLDNLIGK